AILVYLAQRYDGERRFMPGDALAVAQVQRWLSVAAGEIAAGPCTARLVTVFGAPFDHEQAIARAQALFAVMESHLDQRQYLVEERLTLADIAG
ncbi:glutathione S-transferase, partial [Pseudoalteromonas sp. SIMBA_148]